MATHVVSKVRPTKFAFSLQLRGECFLKCIENTIKTTFLSQRELTSSSRNSHLENLACQGEKIVGYQASLLRCLLSDEMSSVIVQSKKLVGSRHPLLKTARRLVYDGAEAFDAVGLIVLLMSRCAEGLTTKGAPFGQDVVSGIQKKQRKLAEVAESINTGYMVHLGMVNKSDFQPTDDVKIMNFGNKITILTGDFLLAKASVGLSELNNAEVVDIMAGIIGDIVEGEALKDYKTLCDTNLVEWEEVIFKSQGSIFAKSCLATLKLCFLSQQYQDAGFAFGKNLALLQQVLKDYQELMTDLKTISLNNVAVIQNKHILPENILEKPVSTVISVDKNAKLKLQHSEIAQQIKDLATCYGNKALENLERFPSSKARVCLENLVSHLMLLQNI